MHIENQAVDHGMAQVARILRFQPDGEPEQLSEHIDRIDIDDPEDFVGRFQLLGGRANHSASSRLIGVIEQHLEAEMAAQFRQRGGDRSENAWLQRAWPPQLRATARPPARQTAPPPFRPARARRSASWPSRADSRTRAASAVPVGEHHVVVPLRGHNRRMIGTERLHQHASAASPRPVRPATCVTS